MTSLTLLANAWRLCWQSRHTALAIWLPIAAVLGALVVLAWFSAPVVALVGYRTVAFLLLALMAASSVGLLATMVRWIAVLGGDSGQSDVPPWRWVGLGLVRVVQIGLLCHVATTVGIFLVGIVLQGAGTLDLIVAKASIQMNMIDFGAPLLTANGEALLAEGLGVLLAAYVIARYGLSLSAAAKGSPSSFRAAARASKHRRWMVAIALVLVFVPVWIVGEAGAALVGEMQIAVQVDDAGLTFQTSTADGIAGLGMVLGSIVSVLAALAFVGAILAAAYRQLGPLTDWKAQPLGVRDTSWHGVNSTVTRQNIGL